MKHYFYWILFVSVLLGCKKSNPDSTIEEKQIQPPQTRDTYLADEGENLIKDSVFYYTKLFSLWQDALPFKDLNDLNKPDLIRTNYTQYFRRSEDVLDWLVSLTPKNTETGAPIDRYSFLDRVGAVSDEIQHAVATSFGMEVFYLQSQLDPENGDLFIRMVDKNSSAEKVGLRRGDRILSINGNENIDFISQRAQGFSGLNMYLNSSTLDISIQKPDGESEAKTIKSERFNFNPIQDYRVLSVGGEKVGYLAFSSFVSIENQDNGPVVKTPMYSAFEEVFGSFQAAGINEMVVDLRYNGGGSVLTAEYLADNLAPASANKQLMYTTSMNSYFQREGWTRPGGEFQPIFFQKKGALDLKKIYFLVSANTASASELLINVLKPYMTVHLIGTMAVDDDGREVKERTYGKPVGFWEWPIVEDSKDVSKNVSLYAASFKTYNKSGDGDYFNGLEPLAHVWEFSSFRDFGDREETMLQAALTHIETGSFVALRLRSSTRIRKNKVRDARILHGNKTNGRMFKFQKETKRFKK